MDVCIFLILLSSQIIVENVIGQYLDFNCAGSFHPYSRENVIEITYREEEECWWHLKATPGDRFQLWFSHDFDCQQEIPNIEVYDGYSTMSTAGCQARETQTNDLWVKYTYKEWRRRINEEFNVTMSIVTSRLEYHVSNTPLSWRAAEAHCQVDGGTLAVMYPLKTTEMNELAYDMTSPLWYGQSISPWVWLRGCVSWPNIENVPPVYSKSKYNQFAECSWACLGSAYFLLQDTSCYCINETVSEKRELYDLCHTPCPGDDTETCGGDNTFTKYQYYTEAEQDIMLDTMLDDNCMTTSTAMFPVQSPTDCRSHQRFTCEFLNGTSQTFLSQLSWSMARYFCAQKDTYGLKAVPLLTEDLKVQWTSVVRKVDWNYPSVSQRRPSYSYLNIGAQVNIRPSSERHSFVCQYEIVTCGENFTGDNGEVMSPGYPGNYSTNDHCVWQIQVDSGFVVEIVWHALKLEDSDLCIYDYIEIQEYPTGMKARFCGRDIPDTFISKTPQLRLVFMSDNSITEEGFRLSWKAETDSSSVDAPPESDESMSRKSGISGGVVVGITVSLTVVIAMVIIGVILLKRRWPQQRNRFSVKQNSAGISNAVYGTSSVADSEFSSTSRAYQNEAQAHAQRSLMKADSDADYENVQKPVKRSEGKTANKENAATETSGMSLSELDNLGMENIKVESTQKTVDTMESHEYETVPDKQKQRDDKKTNKAALGNNQKVCKRTGDYENSRNRNSNTCHAGNVYDEANDTNVYHEITNVDVDMDVDDGLYLQPCEAVRHVYQELH